MRRRIQTPIDGAQGHWKKERTRMTNGLQWKVEVKLKIYQKPNTKLLYIMHLPYFPNPMTPYIT